MPTPRVEFLWWRGCPSHERALAELVATMESLGLDPEAVDVREVRSEEEAEDAGFPGSPTIRVDGTDVSAPGSIEGSRLNCRVYRHRDGRPSPLPDRHDVRDALVAAGGEKAGLAA